MNKIDKEFNQIAEAYYKRNRTKKIQTDCQALVQLMLDKPKKTWWWSYEFVGQVNSKNQFLSHRAPARASDLCKDTYLVEDRRIGKLKVYRLQTEFMHDVKEFLNT